MISFDLNKFLFNNRLNLTELSIKINQPKRSLYAMADRGTIKPSFLRKLEEKFGDCEEYIISQDEKITSLSA